MFRYAHNSASRACFQQLLHALTFCLKVRGAGTVESWGSHDPPKIYPGVKHGILTPDFFGNRYFLVHSHTLLLRLHHNYVIF